MELKFRTLEANEIDVRVQSARAEGVILLLYKDARCDMNILDEAVGVTNWKREHCVVNNNLFCTVSIWDEGKKQWITKQDVGTESKTEQEKGQASDSFKRACVNWGIGRELYTAPLIWVPVSRCKNFNNRNNHFSCSDRFEVTHIAYDEHRRIKELEIKNLTLKSMAYTFGGNK